ncbi:MAG TPA: TlpA disulfide reductase family protein, partial [Phycisphaerae bacterium]|nr:TlpA disulfide reductase family protein [Phycisphaerae bacterium]
MTLSRLLTVTCVLVWGALARVAAAADKAAPPQTTTAPSTAPAAEKMVPDSTLQEIREQWRQPEGLGREQAMELFPKRMKKVLQLGEKAEKDYPEAPNLHVVRTMMLRAAAVLLGIGQDKSYEKKILEISRRVMDSDAPPEAKVQPDWMLVKDKVSAGKLGPKQQAEEIRTFVGRYRGSPAEMISLVVGSRLAADTMHFDVLRELIGKIKAHKDAKDPKVQEFLEEISFIGRPFEAELATIDGKKLSLPKDLAGKVVVIDFWATWCGPCVAEIPHMKKVYAEYKPKGVEFVGISLDQAGDLDKLKA